MPLNKVNKSIEMTDAKILYISLVGKAANKKQFLITKAADQSDDKLTHFQTFGRILKSDDEMHYITGIVYEPMEADTDDNYMTAQEIEKAEYWYMKNAQSVDLQHDYEPLEKATVVESYLAPDDMEIAGQPIKKGTWIATIEVDAATYELVQKGEITGFSMGGVGMFATEQTELEKSDTENTEVVEKKSILKSLAKMLGFGNFEPVEKGVVADMYSRRIKGDNLWTAFYALEDALYGYNPLDGSSYTGDITVIEAALSDFTEIVTNLLGNPGAVEKAVKEMPMEKAEDGNTTLSHLKSIEKSVGRVIQTIEKEGNEMTKEDLEAIGKMLDEKIEKALKPAEAQKTENPVEKSTEEAQLTKEEVSAMITSAIQKAMNPDAEEEEEEAEPTQEEVINKAVADALAPILKAAGLPTNLNGTEQSAPEEECFLHGII